MATKPTRKKIKAAKAKVAPKSKVKKAVKKQIKPIAKKAAVKAKPAKSATKATKSKKVIAAKSKKPVKKVVAKVKPVVKKAVKTKAPKVVAKQKPVTKPVIKTAKPVAKKEVLPVLKKVETPVVKKPVIKLKPKVAEPLDNRTRYSDAELNEFRDLIHGKLETSRSELKYLQEQISRSSEMGDDSDARFKGLEDGTSTSEREYLSQMASRQIQYIGHLEKALIRIENKTYGICRETGRLISKERLRAVPHATLSIEAKQGGKG